MRHLILSVVFLGAAGAAIFWLAQSQIFTTTRTYLVSGNPFVEAINAISKELEAPKINPSTDIEPQKPLDNPPTEIKALYATGWSAGSKKKMDYLIDIIKETELNAIVIDIKDFSGYILYDTGFEPAKNYDAVEIRIPKINALIKKLHDENIYIIARLSVFQDPRLALARPDLALMSSSTGKLWRDNKGLNWIDAASQEAWDYNIGIAKDVLGRGFDEINFDYIRFPSDGKLADIIYPFWDQKTPLRKVMKSFFTYLRAQLPDARISADLFGLVTVDTGDLGIGQYLEDAMPYFDYIAPMVYPSHYHSGFIGYKNPGAYPYEIIKYSMETAIKRLITYNQQLTTNIATSTGPSVVSHKLSVKFRPWLQDFDLGAVYNADMVRKEIQAVYDAATSTDPALVNGWMLWDPANTYTRDALRLETAD